MIPRPILFIHGFGGRPEHWVQDGFPQFLVREGGFDPELMHLFSYGTTRTVEDGRLEYNNEGDMRQIARRLASAVSDAAEDLECVVDYLVEKSVRKGGPAKVDLVCHSIGGLIARYYLSCREPDEHGTCYKGNVRRVIMIGTPQLGLLTLNLAQALVPPGSLLRRVLEIFEKLPWTVGKFSGRLQDLDDYWLQVARVAAKELRDPHTETAFDSPAVAQTRPDSDFIKRLNAPDRLPTDVEYHLLYGDIYFQLDLQLFGLRLLRQRRSFGDFLIPAASSSILPNAPYKVYPFETQLGGRIRLGRHARMTSQEKMMASLNGVLPPTAHGNLRRNPDVQRKVLEILSA